MKERRFTNLRSKTRRFVNRRPCNEEYDFVVIGSGIAFGAEFALKAARHGSVAGDGGGTDSTPWQAVESCVRVMKIHSNSHAKTL
jgi:hypothetical protein